MTLEELKASIHDYLGQSTTLYRFVAFIHPTIHRRWVRKKTCLLIDGYPRCANTFAYHGFLEAHNISVENSSHTNIAHHTHQPAQILRGVELGVPTLVLIREPIGCVSSLIVRNSKLSIEYALKRYVKFYKKVIKVKNKTTVGSFDQVVSNYGRVIKKVNSKFEINFEIPSHTKNFEKKVFDRINWINKKTEKGSRKRISKPDNKKEKEKEKLKVKIENSRWVEEAKKIYRKMIEA